MTARLVLIALAASVLGGVSAPSDARAQGPDEVYCNDPGVRTGDTLTCGGREIRLWGVAAPAVGEPGHDEAVAALKRLVRFREVRCRVRRELTPTSDVAICHVGARDLAAFQVREGHARSTRGD